MKCGSKKSKDLKKKKNHFNVGGKKAFVLYIVFVSHSKVFIPKGEDNVLRKPKGMEDCHSIEMSFNNILMRNWVAKP